MIKLTAMTPRPLQEIDYVAVGEAFRQKGFEVREVPNVDPEIQRWEYTFGDLHVWIFPTKPEAVVIEGLVEGAEPEEQRFDCVPLPSQVKFLGYARFFDALRRFAYTGDEEV